MSDKEVVEFLERKLEEVEARIEEARLSMAPDLEESRRLRAALHAATAGVMGSGGISDEQIIEHLRQARRRMTAPEVAAGMGLDTRGISRRLPRMVKDGLLEGSPEEGYRVPKRER